MIHVAQHSVQSSSMPGILYKLPPVSFLSNLLLDQSDRQAYYVRACGICATPHIAESNGYIPTLAPRVLHSSAFVIKAILHFIA